MVLTGRIPHSQICKEKTTSEDWMFVQVGKNLKKVAHTCCSMSVMISSDWSNHY